MKSTFEEKSYESYFNCELNKRSKIFFPPGQVQEGNLGFDATAFSGNRMLWRTLGYPFWFFSPFSGIELHEVAEHLEHRLGVEIDNMPNMKTNLIFQYKRPEFIAASTGKEWPHWSEPYYRYDIYKEQQKILIEIHNEFKDKVLVVYASPALHNVNDLVQSHLKGRIISDSNFRKASELETHHRNTYTKSGTHSICCSEPEKLEKIDIISAIENVGANTVTKGSNRQFIINFRKRLASILSEDETIGQAFVQLSNTYSEFEQFELLYSFLTLSTFRSLTGNQWLVSF